MVVVTGTGGLLLLLPLQLLEAGILLLRRRHRVMPTRRRLAVFVKQWEGMEVEAGECHYW